MRMREVGRNLTPGIWEVEVEEDGEFKSGLGSIVKPCFQKQGKGGKLIDC